MVMLLITLLVCNTGSSATLKTYNKGYYMCSNLTRPYKTPILISFLSGVIYLCWLLYVYKQAW